jgi:glycine amidinotransferase
MVNSNQSVSPVGSFNEWDPLEEVIVGRLDGATIPSYEDQVVYKFPSWKRLLYRFAGGRPYPSSFIRHAEEQLAGFVELLESRGIRVRRPDVVPFGRKYGTPYWSSRGFCSSCPRDGVLIVGDQVIETPMSWRSRYFETFAYRSLFREYFAAGARWVSAPKPELKDDLNIRGHQISSIGPERSYLVNDTEPVFDAADCIRCGRDIFIQKSNVTNDSGIEWLRRYLGDEYRLHTLVSSCPHPMHIDSTFMPLAPGKLLVNREWMPRSQIPEMFKSWEILEGPEPDPAPRAYLGLARRFSMVSKWINLNVLMLDTKRVVVEASQVSMIKAMEKWGFEPIPCPFMWYTLFGGTFHCATLDIRRRGKLESYF